jgi:hypothetical protein
MKCNGLLQANGLSSFSPTMTILLVDRALQTASNTHWTIGLPATSTKALGAPFE